MGEKTNMEAQYSTEVLNLVKAIARDMICVGETTKKARFGHNFDGGFFWISRDREKVINPTEIEVDGVLFYFGIFEK